MKNLVVVLVVLGVVGVVLIVAGARLVVDGAWVGGLLLVVGGNLIGACVPLLALLWVVGVNPGILEEIEKLDDKPRR